ncbi:hypothetical protein [Anaerobranca gottschalkii]|uniref:Uncharacterized protein n=1 Tax=Anaerobranca gottschalkii DSM 13577 TaxID=1120990 RepID=A0A1H9YCH2_9FIRM|nr:hypothetical protein [Anaerobranca gottschalkii]SES66526.1 hypothetical protein SAMN03080614_1002100 [Anaerobranca gottschalkii DSM 13577]
MNKWISMLTLGILILGLLFTIVNIGLEEKYGEIQYFLRIDLKMEKIYIGYYAIPIPNIRIASIYREDNNVIIHVYNKKIKIPIIINLLELNNTPLLR